MLGLSASLPLPAALVKDAREAMARNAGRPKGHPSTALLDGSERASQRTFVALRYARERSARSVSAPKVPCQLVELAEYPLSELYIGGGQRVVELVGSARANDGRGDGWLV